ncbi:hypothetical protein KL925_001152 [Ogataea polymorpha]|uniref:FHA domain-containing protein n=1 Tax=Ogataea polymorpha TaxID=460523 RepID=A0A9P8PEW0_9ASCO|nr:hypothetical protein KL925_001152 [Ogataea polymorpha]KAH3670002.1 hypothetical protein OGATHE_002815 [Ogataea polymorpha]
MSTKVSNATTDIQRTDQPVYQRKRSASKTQSNYNSVNNNALYSGSSLSSQSEPHESDPQPPRLQKFAHVVKFVSPDQSQSELVKILNVPLAPESLKIGRQNVPKITNKITDGYFDSRVLSRNHAELFIKDNKLYIRDLKSSNGTFINDEKLEPHKEYELKLGDKLDLGTTLESQVAHKKITCKVVELTYMSLEDYENVISQTLSKGDQESKKLELFNSSLDALIFSDVIEEQEDLVLESLMDEVAQVEKKEVPKRKDEDKIVTNLTIKQSAKLDDVVRKLIISINNEYIQQQRLREISKFMKNYTQYTPKAFALGQSDSDERVRDLEGELISLREQLAVARASETDAAVAVKEKEEAHSKVLRELESVKSKLGSVLDELEKERTMKLQAQKEIYSLGLKVEELTRELESSKEVSPLPTEPLPRAETPKHGDEMHNQKPDDIQIKVEKPLTVRRQTHTIPIYVTSTMMIALAIALLFKYEPTIVSWISN